MFIVFELFYHISELSSSRLTSFVKFLFVAVFSQQRCMSQTNNRYLACLMYMFLQHIFDGPLDNELHYSNANTLINK